MSSMSEGKNESQEMSDTGWRRFKRVYSVCVLKALMVKKLKVIKQKFGASALQKERCPDGKIPPTDGSLMC